jgi:deazaflavin-dependent oxidoreductase (nitroreductase family)
VSDDESTSRAASTTNEWNEGIIKEFRSNDGVVGGPFTGAPILLLHTSGAKSGHERVNPMMYLPHGERIYVFASKAGAPTNPDWYHNLLAHPKVTVELGTETFEAIATPLEGDARDRMYAEQAALYPGFAEYQAKTTRVIPVVEVVRS